MVTGSAVIALIAYKRPLKTPRMNQAEIIEELTVLSLMYLIPCFTDWMPDLEVRNRIGYVFIFIIVAMFVIFISVKQFMSAKNKCKLHARRKFIKKSMKNAEL